MAVSKRLRYEVLRRDNHTCRYCGATAPDVPLRVDHVVPVALGGADDPGNLVTACQDCNSGKTSSSPDAALVTNVSDDALRWADAIKQAAEELRSELAPRNAYRDAFHLTWLNWTRSRTAEPLPLPDGWKTSLDNFREAGLPQDVWPDIVERAMTNQAVRADNLFRYCCGIAWRMVRDLQDRAKVITGSMPGTSATADALMQAVLDVWIREQPDTDVAPEDRARFLENIAAIRAKEEPHRLFLGAQYAAWCESPDVAAALAGNDCEELRHQWWTSWLTRVGDSPPEELDLHVRDQIDALLTVGVNSARIARAAVYAGSRHSAALHFGLDADEQKLTGATEYTSKAVETWRDAYHASSGRWPSKPEREAFFESLWRAGDDGDIYVTDIWAAAAAAGAYQDPDITTCLTRHLSVFEIAARPLVPAA